MGFTKQQFELLAPGGDLESIKAAIAAGTDAIYCGLNRFNARNRAENITVDILEGVIALAHQHECKIFLTLNIVLLESEIPAMLRLLRQLAHTDVDGIIVQDLGLAYLIKQYFPTLDMHASTQMNTHNEGQIALLGKLGMSRVNLSRELNIDDITHLAQFGGQHNVVMEVFVHGSYCIGFSGVCYFSSVRSGASGNRGRCSQPCRDKYQTTAAGKDYPLNLKDNSAYLDLEALAKAGVYSLKIEGRIKKSHYVYTVVDNWRKQIDNFCQSGEILTDMTSLYSVFNRDFTNGYLQGDIDKNMYIDNPRNHAATHFTEIYQCHSPSEAETVKKSLYDNTTDIMQHVQHLIKDMQIVSSHRSSLKGGEKLTFALPKRKPRHTQPPSLSVLIVDVDQLSLLAQFPAVQFFYQLPDALHLQLDTLIDLFSAHSGLIPYFPAIVVGQDYQAAARFLEQVRPEWIVTDNLGVAHLAQQYKIQWIAGPQLNITNSLALECLAKTLHSSGAFISNELKAMQMRSLARPDNFRLFYSIFHPIHLLTSGQCLFMQSVGCKKTRMNSGCIKRCAKTASIVSLNNQSYIIHKEQGSHNRLYAEQHFLNLDILHEHPGLFTDVMIDLRHIPTQTRGNEDERSLIFHFLEMLQGNHEARPILQRMLSNTTNQQYIKGL